MIIKINANHANSKNEAHVSFVETLFIGIARFLCCHVYVT